MIKELRQVNLIRNSGQKLLLLDLNKILIILCPMNQVRNRFFKNHKISFRKRLNHVRRLPGNIVSKKREIIQK